MELIVRIPDNLAATLTNPNGDLARDVLESYTLEGYKSGKLTSFQIQGLLGFKTPMEVDVFLKDHGVISEEGNFWYDLLKQEDNLFTNRNNFFLVGEAMLLAAAATLLPAKGNFNPLATIAICLAGILTTLICLLANTRHIFVTEVFIKNQLKRTHYWWQAARDDRKGMQKGRPWWIWTEIPAWKRRWKRPQIPVPSKRWVKMHVWTGILLPVILLLLWISLLVAPLLGA